MASPASRVVGPAAGGVGLGLGVGLAGTTDRKVCTRQVPPRYMGNLRTDWARNVDFGLMKYFRITERVRTQFCGDFFNLFNTPQFGALGTTFSTGNFGRATGTMNSPRNVQLGLKIDF